MANIDAICLACDPKVRDVFLPGGTRQSEVIAGDLFVSDQCFVRDEIRFLNNGRLIFVPRERDGHELPYFKEYFVICRKLTIIGGSDPIILNPCGPDDPGHLYQGNDVITWRDRLVSAASGPGPNPFHAADGASHDPNNWSDVGQGNSGAAGGNGANGGGGSNGANGRHALDVQPREAGGFSLVVLEVEAPIGSHLTIDFDGQNGGKGGRGQNGGAGGNGMGGRDGETDPDWPSADDCERQPGSGGSSGSGGDGGRGVKGGDGGHAVEITILSTPAQIGAGPLISGLGNLILHPAFGADVVLNGVITVDRFQVTGIVPANAARGGRDDFRGPASTPAPPSRP